MKKICAIICMAALLLSGCGEKVTADRLIKDAQEKAKKVESLKANMLMEMEMGMEAEGESMSLGMNMNMDMEMLQDPMLYHMEGSLDMGELGMSLDMEIYGEAKDKELITYVNTLGEWQKTTQEADLENSMVQMVELDSFIMDGMELVLAEETEQVNGKEAYVITAEMSGEAFQEVYETLLENMSGELGNLEELGMDMNYENMSMNICYKIYKDTHLPAEVSMTTSEDSKMTISMAGVNLDFNKLDCKVVYTEFDTIESIEIPEEAKNAEEVNTDLAAGEGLESCEQDENGNYILNDYEEKGTAAIALVKGYQFAQDYSDPYTITFVSEDNTREITYYLTMLSDEWTEKDVEETYANSKDMYTEDLGFKDVEISEIKELKAGKRNVKYITYTYKAEDGIACKEYNAWTVIDNGCVVECYLYETGYDKANSALTEETIKSAIEAIQ